MEKIKAKVLKDFLDKETRGLFLKKGDEITRSKERIEYLAKRGLVEAESKKVKEPEKVETIDLSKTWQQVVSDVKKCDNLENLKESLVTEKGNGETRDSVVNALEARIAELEK